MGEDLLVQLLLQGKFADGGTVQVDYPKGSETLTFTKEGDGTEVSKADHPGPSRKKKGSPGEVVEPEVVD